MIRQVTSNSALQVTVTPTATYLSDLMDTANWAKLFLPSDVDAIELSAEWAVRYSVSGTPTTAIGQQLASGANKTLLGVNPTQIKLIAWTNTKVNVDVGYTVKNILC